MKAHNKYQVRCFPFIFEQYRTFLLIRSPHPRSQPAACGPCCWSWRISPLQQGLNVRHAGVLLAPRKPELLRHNFHLLHNFCHHRQLNSPLLPVVGRHKDAFCHRARPAFSAKISGDGGIVRPCPYRQILVRSCRARASKTAFCRQSPSVFVIRDKFPMSN